MATETTATTEAHGGAAEAHHESFLGFDAAGWVALAMIILFGIMWSKKVHVAVASALDGKIAEIRNQLDEATRVRAEAEALLADYRAKQQAAERDAADIVANARAEAERLVAKAKADAESTIARRTRQAEDKIAAAQRSVESELRAQAANLGTEAARKLIAAQAESGSLKGLTDKAIQDMDGRLN